MKKVLLGIIGLVVIAAAAITFYIASIDWNEHKDELATHFTELTGKKIVFDGPVSFKLLPSPYLSASKVKIFNPGSEKDLPLVDINKLVANLSLVPLLKGDFDVKRMVMESPQINVEISDDGSLNWEYPLTPEQRHQLENTSITLNSVSLENATVNVDDPYHNINFKLDDLNGEIVAQSVFGPYRIEGNYIKDNNPEGFAISMGQLSESFATTLNMVFTHPGSKSYVRFDGSFLLTNKVLNGNVIVESQQLHDFVKANLPHFEVKKEYDYPLALTFDLSANEQQLNLSNMVIKYGDTQGAGNIQIPLNDGLQKSRDAIKPRVEMAFNFTDFNLNPVVYSIKEFFQKYYQQQEIFQPDMSFDMLVDIKSVRTVYNEQPVKNFEASFDVVDNIVNLNKLTATLPGETDVRLKGDMMSSNEEPFYNLDVSFNSSDFLKTLNWLDLQPKFSAASTYRKAVGAAKLSGTLNKIQISPFNLTMDKSTLSGEAGIKLADRTDFILVLNGDMVNFDNYITPLPAEERGKPWAQRMQYRFGKLSSLNDFDMQLTGKLDLAIYENMPYEKVDIKLNLLEGKMDIERLNINSAANAKIELEGMVSGFGKVPAFENLKYGIKTGDAAAVINKFEFNAPNLDYKQLKNFESRGIATGSLDRFAIKAVSKLENLDFAYAGQVNKEKDGRFNYDGTLEVKHPDFVKMLNSFNVSYNPQAYSLGLFNLKTKIVGQPESFRADPLNFNIGFNSFEGNVSYEKGAEKPSILTSLSINKFEIERFLNGFAGNQSAAAAPVISVSKEEVNEFLERPQWSSNRINYDFYKKFDLSGSFNVGELSYKNQVVREASFDALIGNNNFSVNKLKGNYRDGDLEGKFGLTLSEKAILSGEASLNNAETNLLNLSGNRYGINNGRFNGKLTFNGEAESWANIVKTLSGNLDFSFSDVTVKGWNLNAIYSDIIKRQVPEGLVDIVKENLESGETKFTLLKGKLSLNEGEFSLSDASLGGGAVNVGVYGDGNLTDWTLNLLFNVKYDEPKYLPGYSFALKGPANAPLLDVNVSALYDLYKSRQDKIEAQKQAVIEAEQNRLRALVDEQRKAAIALAEDVKNNLYPEIEAKLKTAESQQTISDYNKLKQLLGRESALIAATAQKANAEELSDGLIAEMSQSNRSSTAALEKIRQALVTAYLNDLRYQNDKLYKQITDNYNDSKMLLFTYNTKRDTLNQRLSTIVSNFKLEEDANIVGWQKFIADKEKSLSDQNAAILDKYKQLQGVSNPEPIEDYNRELADFQDAMEANLTALAENVAEFIKYSEEKVLTAEEEYAEKLRQEEVQRKVKENTGRINIKKSGRSLTVQRDIEEIEKSEELKAQDKLKVLDFSKSGQESMTPKGAKSEGVKKGRVIRN